MLVEILLEVLMVLFIVYILVIVNMCDKEQH